jgi:hypothetical protein
MAKAWFNHVSVFAKDLYESAEFYSAPSKSPTIGQQSGQIA